MSSKQTELAIHKLGIEFQSLDLSFHQMKNAKADDITSYWPGTENEEVLVCVFKGHEISEPLRWAFSMPENRLKSWVSPFQKHKKQPLRSISTAVFCFLRISRRFKRK